MKEVVTVTTPDRPYDYKIVHRAACRRYGRDSISDKDMGGLLKVSERQIRNARKQGMDVAMADLFACRLRILPHDLYGWDAWYTPESFFASDLEDGTVTGVDVGPLFRTKAWI